MAVQPNPIDLHTAQQAARKNRDERPHGQVLLPTLQLLVIEENEFALRSCCTIAREMGFAVHAAGSETEARRLLNAYAFDVVLLDLKIEGGGTPLLEEIRRSRPRASVVVTTAFATVPSAVEAMRTGAVDYLTKPFAMDELTAVLQRAAERFEFDLHVRQLREELQTQGDFDGLIGNSPEMSKLYRMLSKIIPATLPVLISGESGSGKHQVARSIHAKGPNVFSPFIRIDSSAEMTDALEAKLFDNAQPDHAARSTGGPGALACAGATVYLAEIGMLSPAVQGRLLRALQDKEFVAGGRNEAVPVRARLLAGTNRDLKRMVDSGAFRRDLYMRLNVVNLRVPALRERRSDIPLLAEHFLRQICRERRLSRSLSRETMELLQAYEWPGNVRELELALERAVVLSSGPVLETSDLTTQLENFRRSLEPAPLLVDARVPRPPASDRATGEASAPMSMAERERRAILTTLAELHGDKLMAAKLLGIGKTTLYRKLKEYGIKQA